MAGGSPDGVRWDFTVSFVEADRGWADWLVWQLQDAGVRAIAEPPLAPAAGEDAAPALAAATGHAEHVLVVLSDDYLAAVGSAADTLDDAAAGRLVAVRVADCRRPGRFSRVVSFDLFGLERPVAREWLRRQLAVLRTEPAAEASAPPAATPPPAAVPPAAVPAVAAVVPAQAAEDGVEVLAELAGFPSPVRAVEFPASGGLLVTGAQDGKVRLFDLAKPARPTTMVEIEYGARYSQEWVRDLATSADGTRLAVVGDAMRVAVWDLADPAAPELVFSEVGHKHYIRAVALSPDASIMATGGQDKAVALWNTRRSGRQSVLALLTDHRKGVQSVAFSPDGRRLASGGDDKTVILWDVADPEHPTRTASIAAHRDTVHAVRFVTPTLLATAGADRTARLWDITSPAHPEPVAELTGHRKAVTALAVSADATRVATGAADSTVALWDITTPGRPNRLAALSSGYGAVNDLAFSRDGALLAAACAGKTTVLWSIGARLASTTS
ncbi:MULTISPECIES: TIR domain-containing protein [unclassified Frankia]|uniref:toll/interleukin-1 receptor domain-containing protein n=1 Tax=unclassified Frankia TaxID=2632575 RepID=UPI0027DD4B4F|nr:MULTISPECIES: TIR domain-containing protein [unclassified Frankia]